MNTDAETVKDLYSKAMAGGQLTKTEKAALKRYEREKEGRLRDN